MQDDLVNAEQQQEAHSGADGINEQLGVHHGAHLLGKHRQVGFRDGDEDPHQEAHSQQHADPA